MFMRAVPKPLRCTKIFRRHHVELLVVILSSKSQCFRAAWPWCITIPVKNMCQKTHQFWVLQNLCGKLASTGVPTESFAVVRVHTFGHYASCSRRPARRWISARCVRCALWMPSHEPRPARRSFPRGSLQPGGFAFWGHSLWTHILRLFPQKSSETLASSSIRSDSFYHKFDVLCHQQFEVSVFRIQKIYIRIIFFGCSLNVLLTHFFLSPSFWWKFSLRFHFYHYLCQRY